MKTCASKLSPLLLLSAAIVYSGCFDGSLFFSQTGNGTLRGGEITEAAKTETNDLLVAKLDAKNATTQLVTVGSNSAIQSASVAIAPGSLAVDTTITMEEGGNMASQSTSSELGLSGNSFAEAGNAVIIDSSVAMDTMTPMTISIPMPAASRLMLTANPWENLVVIYRVINVAENSASKSGLITGDQLKINEDGTVSFPTTHFGIFQAVVTALKVEKPIEVASEKPIVSKREEKKNPAAVWSIINQKFNETARTVTLSATASEVPSVGDCAIHIDDDKNLPFSVVKSTPNGPSYEYKALSIKAEDFFVQFECTDAFGRSTISDWVEVKIPTGPDPEPVTTIVSHPAPISKLLNADFTFSCDGVCSYEYRTNPKALWIVAPVNLSLPATEGNNTLEVRAVSINGSRDATPASYSWLVDSIAPIAPTIETLKTTLAVPSGPGATIVNSNTFFFVWGPASDGGSGVSSYDLEYFSGSACSTGKVLISGLTTTSYEFTAGINASTYSFRVIANDAAGNHAQSDCSGDVLVDTLAPIISASSQTAITVDKNPSFTFSGSDATTGIQYIECKLDAQPYAACVSPKSYTAIVDGSHTFSVRAVDTANNKSLPFTTTWTIDTIAPTAPSTLTARADSTVGIDTVTDDDLAGFYFIWNPASDSGSGIAGYTLKRFDLPDCSGAPVDTSALTNSTNYFFVSAPTPEATYSFKIIAFDIAGNSSSSACSTNMHISVPSVILSLSPANTSTLNVTNAVSPGPAVTFTLQNSGVSASGLLNFSGFSGTNPSSFQISSNSCSSILASGTSCNFTVSPIRSQDGTYSASLLIGDGTYLSNPVSLSGTANGFVATASTSVLSTNNSTVPAGNSVTLSLTARDKAGNPYLLGPDTVIFMQSGGSSTGSISATTYVGSGVYTALFTGNHAGTPTSIGATINGVTVTTSLPTITVIPGAASPLTSLITVSPSTIILGNTSILTMITRDAQGNNLTSGGTAVTFTMSGAGTSNGSMGGFVDNNDGTYSAVFTGTGQGSPISIGGIIVSTPISTTLPAITVTGPALLALNDSGPYGEVNIGRSRTRRITLLNSGSNPASNIAVSGISGAWAMQNNSCSVTLAAGANCTFDVVFTASTIGANSSAIVVGYNNGVTTTTATRTLSAVATSCFGAHRYWTITRPNMLSTAGWSLAEVKMYEELADATPATPVLIITENPNGTEANLVDGNLSTVWTDAASGVNEPYVIFDFGASQTGAKCIKRVDATTPDSSSLGKVLVSFSDDAAAWTPAWSFDLKTTGEISSSNIFMGINKGPMVTFKKVVAGMDSTCALTTDGKPVCWGGNTYGQAGVGTLAPTNLQEPEFVKLSGLPGDEQAFIDLSIGTGFACGITVKHNAYCWGDQTSGKLGNGNGSGSSSLPVAVNVAGFTTGISKKFRSISSGTAHTCAVNMDGKVYCWGEKNNGKLGDGSASGVALVPVAILPGVVPTLSRLVSVSASAQSTCAASGEGTLYCWGNNSSGELGDGTNTSKTSAVAVSTGTNAFTSFSGGGSHMCAIQGNGVAKCWGSDATGELGNGATAASVTPGPVDTSTLPATASFIQISAGGNHSCGVISTGVIFCWGADSNGQLGHSSVGSSQFPDNLDLPTELSSQAFTSVSAGLEHSCGITGDGQIYCWGGDTYGQLGNGASTGFGVPHPISLAKLIGSTTAKEIALGHDFSCDLSGYGSVYCSGDNSFGQLGNSLAGTARSTRSAINDAGISGVKSFRSIVAGNFHSCGLTADGRAFCWGSGSSGQLGQGGAGGSSADPVPVDMSAMGANVRFSSLALGDGHSCGITTEGLAYCWGNGSNGRLGTNTNTNSTSPIAVAVTNLVAGEQFKSLALGMNHSCGLTSFGNIYCWGEDIYGQLGNGAVSSANASIPTPIDVAAISNTYSKKFISIYAGPFHTCAINSGGKTYCWGEDANEKLGNAAGAPNMCNGATPCAMSPIPVVDSELGTESFFVKLALGRDSTCGISADGDTYCWGDDTSGQLGNATVTGIKNIPTVIGGFLPAVSAVAVDLNASFFYACRIGSNATRQCWGENISGQFGNGNTTSTIEPLTVEQSHLSSPNRCPNGYILVNGVAEYGTTDFCVAKYEMKTLGGLPISTAAGLPQVAISATTAQSDCLAISGSHHLMTNNEYMSIARSIEANSGNWSSGTYGQGQMNTGHSDSLPNSALAAAPDDTLPCSETQQTCSMTSFSDQRRTHNLSNGSTIWDFSGNVSEWIDFPGSPTDCATSAPEFVSSACSASVRRDIAPSSPTFTSTQGMGLIYAGNNGGVVRGGSWNQTTDLAGVYSIRLDPALNGSTNFVGFRCTKSLP